MYKKNNKLQRILTVLKIIRKAHHPLMRWCVNGIMVDVVTSANVDFELADTEVSVGLLVLKQRIICIINESMPRTVDTYLAIEREVHGFLSPRLSVITPGVSPAYSSYFKYEFIPIWSV